MHIHFQTAVERVSAWQQPVVWSAWSIFACCLTNDHDSMEECALQSVLSRGCPSMGRLLPSFCHVLRSQTEHNRQCENNILIPSTDILSSDTLVAGDNSQDSCAACDHDDDMTRSATNATIPQAPYQVVHILTPAF